MQPVFAAGACLVCRTLALDDQQRAPQRSSPVRANFRFTSTG